MTRVIAACLSCCCTAALLSCMPGGALSGARATPLATEQGDHSRDIEPVRSADAVMGEWDIVSFDGYQPSRRAGTSRAAFADFGADGVALQIECNASGVNGRVVDGSFRASPASQPQTAIGCGPVQEGRDAALFAFFRSSPSVGSLGDGRLLLRAGSHEVLLERPATRRLAFIPSADDLAGEWHLAELSRTISGSGRYGIGLSELPGLIILSGDRASYTQCPRLDFKIELSADGRLTKTGGPALPAVGQECGALATPRGHPPGMPLPWDALRVLHGDPLVERSGADAIVLTAGELSLLLTRK